MTELLEAGSCEGSKDQILEEPGFGPDYATYQLSPWASHITSLSLCFSLPQYVDNNVCFSDLWGFVWRQNEVTYMQAIAKLYQW